jgi:hypothetical protein
VSIVNVDGDENLLCRENPLREIPPLYLRETKGAPILTKQVRGCKDVGCTCALARVELSKFIQVKVDDVVVEKGTVLGPALSGEPQTCELAVREVGNGGADSYDLITRAGVDSVVDIRDRLHICLGDGRGAEGGEL